MIGFLARGLEQQLACRGRSCHQGLAVIERLRCDFACVVYTHEGGGNALFGVGEIAGAAGR